MPTVECRCEQIESLHGDEALLYANEHLLVHWREAVADWIDRPGHMEWSEWHRQDWIETTRGHGFGECQCPFTGWRFQESWHPDPAQRELRRRPWTTRADYLRHEVVEAGAADVEATQRQVNATAKRRDVSLEDEQLWSEACEAARIALDTLYSPDLDDLVAGIAGASPESSEAAIVFLEVDPWVFRSGYMKQKILKRLARARLTEPDRLRLQRFLISALEKGPRSEFSEMLRLAHHVGSEAFVAQLIESPNDGPRGRHNVERMIAAVEGSRRSSAWHRRRRRG